MVLDRVHHDGDANSWVSRGHSGGARLASPPRVMDVMVSKAANGGLPNM
jgi:hypothetical protein